MLTNREWCAVALAIFLVTGPLRTDDKNKKEDKPKFDATKLVGNWQYVSGMKGGEKVPEERLKAQKAVISKETFTLTGEAKFVMKYELDAKKSPVGIKFTITESPFGPGAKAEGILELKGDELTLCYASEGGAAPKKFESKKDTKDFLFVLKRSK